MRPGTSIRGDQGAPAKPGWRRRASQQEDAGAGSSQVRGGGGRFAPAARGSSGARRRDRGNREIASPRGKFRSDRRRGRRGSTGSRHGRSQRARAGAHEWGYVEPTEAAWEILEEAVEPFVADIERRIALGLEDAALQLCQGMVLGLYCVERGKGGELAQWAPDFAAEAAGGAIIAWLTGSRTGTATGVAARRNLARFSLGFVDRFVPEWQDMIRRILSRAR